MKKMTRSMMLLVTGVALLAKALGCGGLEEGPQAATQTSATLTLLCDQTAAECKTICQDAYINNEGPKTQQMKRDLLACKLKCEDDPNHNCPDLQTDRDAMREWLKRLECIEWCNSTTYKVATFTVCNQANKTVSMARADPVMVASCMSTKKAACLANCEDPDRKVFVPGQGMMTPR